METFVMHVCIGIIVITLLAVFLIIGYIIMTTKGRKNILKNILKNDNDCSESLKTRKQIKKFSFSERKLRKDLIKKINDLENNEKIVSKNEIISSFEQLLKEIKTKFEFLFLDILEEKENIIDKNLKISFAKINGFEYSYYKNRLVFSKDDTILFETENDEFKEVSDLENYYDCLTEELNYINSKNIIFELKQNILEKLN